MANSVPLYKAAGFAARMIADRGHYPVPFLVGWLHGYSTKKHCSIREAVEHFTHWDSEEIAAYLNGRDDGFANDTTRVAFMMREHETEDRTKRRLEEIRTVIRESGAVMVGSRKLNDGLPEKSLMKDGEEL